MQSLLTHVSRSTKHTLNRLGIFTVSSFHAYICARSPSLLNNLLAGRGATRRRAVAAPTLSRSNSLSSRKSQSVAAASSQHSSHHHEGDRQFRVNLPDGQVEFHLNVRTVLVNNHFLFCFLFRSKTDGDSQFKRQYDGGRISGQRLRQTWPQRGRTFRARQEAS